MKQINQGQFTPDMTSATIIALPTGRTTLTRNWRTRLAGVVSAGLLAITLAVSIGGPTSAFADRKTGEAYDDATGTVFEFYVDDHGREYVWMTYANGEQASVTYDDIPSPDDDGRGQLYTPQSVQDFLKQFGGVTDPPQDKWDNPLGVELTQRGEGIIPAHNPADVTKTYDDGTGMGGDSPFDPNGGDFTDQLKRTPTGSGDESDDDDSDDPDRGDAGLFDAEMPGPPPLVNPAPVVVIGR